ncbi:hypothetical protein ACS0TY_031405 [Phlomoides rotata]
MEKRRRISVEGGNQAMEENTMAILDTSGFNNSKISHHISGDRLTYLEAVRTASLLPDTGSAPTRKMCEAIFQILEDADSLDLIIESYQLLIELDKRFPRVYLSKGEESDSTSPSRVLSQFTLVEEAWVPFNFGLDGQNERNHSGSSVDSSGFHALVQEIANVDNKMKSGAAEIMFLKNLLLLQYLITVLEGDFLPRHCAYQEKKNWTILRESLLSMLLGSRKIIYKGLLKDCLSIMCNMSQSTLLSEETSGSEKYSEDQLRDVNSAVALTLPEVKKSTCTFLKKLFVMIIELDCSRKIADQQGLTTRADGIRTPAVEIILDELIYDNDILCSFLKVFDPKWKLEIVVQYFQKYIVQSSVQTRRSGGVSVNTKNFDGILKYLSNSKNTRSIVKKISPEVIQLLLAHAFQAYVALSYHVSEGLSDMSEDAKSNPVLEVCKDIVSAFTGLRQEDPDTEILCLGKEALVTAAVILSTKS